MDNKKVQKGSDIYFCKKCDYITSRKSQYERHLSTDKHSRIILDNLDTKKVPDLFKCECGKKYNYLSGLYKHKKICFVKESESIIIVEEDVNDKNLILTLIQQNTELQKQMLDVIKNGTNINNTINNNSNNKTFNLQVFLNETCKDAMNIMEFVDSIKIQLCDMESIGELGYVNGMSKLIIKHLNALEEHMRPVHCSDPKRDCLYVKNQNVWEKEDSENSKLKKALKYICHKNMCALPDWRKKYPDCIYADSSRSTQYNHIVIETMGGPGDNDNEKADKIIKKIAKVVTIDKNNLK